MSDPRRVVVCAGNRFRRDDGAGLELAALLRRRVPDDVGVLTLEGEPTVLLETLSGSDLVILIDAVAGPGQAGEILRFDASDAPVPGNVFGASTHAFGLGETIELARTLGRLTGRVLVYGITGADFSAGEGLTSSVEHAVGQVADRVLFDLSDRHPQPQPRTGPTDA